VSNDALDFLMGQSGAPAKFADVGDKVVGTVLAYEKRQSKDMKGNLKFWDDGSPIYEAVITLQTDARDPEVEDDDGIRRVFARGKMLYAIRDALKAARYRGDIKGGKLGVAFTGLGEAQRGFQAPKLFSAKFEPPAPVDEFDEMSVGQPDYDDGEEPF
jgi:hypothetical protein